MQGIFTALGINPVYFVPFVYIYAVLCMFILYTLYAYKCRNPLKTYTNVGISTVSGVFLTVPIIAIYGNLAFSSASMAFLASDSPIISVWLTV